MQVRSLPEGSTTFLRMEFLMTPGAEGNQVGLGIISQSASWLNVVNLKFDRMAAMLAAPAIALQHLLVELAIGVRVEAQPGPPWVQASHEAFLSCSRNCCCCGGGRN